MADVPSKKKIPFSIEDDLVQYLARYHRLADLPLQYDDLLRYQVSAPLIDIHGEDTLWETVFYTEWEQEALFKKLTKIYALLKTDGDTTVLEHLTVDRVDYCNFGNTRPFRVRIINRLNDNYDHFYVKKVDASRIFGLELEHILSPNNLEYLVHDQTIIEEHIPGLPGDDFLARKLDTLPLNKLRIAKEFVKFNERCFVRLLGDMRAYNFVVDITPDIEGSQYRFRAIDFDQQSYEGWKSFYLPQYFKENNPVVFMGMKVLSPKTVRQYQFEERSLMAHRAKAIMPRLKRLFDSMRQHPLSFPKKVDRLKQELAYHQKNDSFHKCKTMGELVINNFQLLLQKEFKQSIIDLGGEQ